MLTLGKEEQPFFQLTEVKAWKSVWEEKLRQENHSREEVRARMEENNPVVIPRNYLVEDALEHAWKNHDIKPVEELVKAVILMITRKSLQPIRKLLKKINAIGPIAERKSRA